MRSIVNLIKTKGRNLFIFNVILLVLILGFAWKFIFESKSYTAITGDCEVHSIDDLEVCYKKNPYVKIYLGDVYSTNYGYYVSNTLKAYYVDIDVDGYSLITLVSKDVAEELFSDNNTIEYVEGKIVYFSDSSEHDGVIAGIKKDYLKQFGEDYTMDDINNLVLPIQVNAYQGLKAKDILILIVCGGLFVVVLLFAIKGLLMMIKPMSYKGISKVENFDKLEEEYENKAKYESKQLCLLPNYIIKITGFAIKVKKTKDLVWVYQRITKRNGITINKCYMLNFKDGDNFDISMNDESVLNEFKQDELLVGYTSQNSKEYRKIVSKAKDKKQEKAE